MNSLQFLTHVSKTVINTSVHYKMWHLLNIYSRCYVLLCTQDTLNTSITTKVTNIMYFPFKAGNLKNFDGIQLFIAKGREPTHCIISFLLGQKNFLSTEWVDYVEEPMIYQAFLHHFGSVGGWLEGSWGGWVGCLVGWVVVGWGGW